MKNYIRPVLTLLCVVAAAVTYFAFNNILIALLFAACGVMLWAFFGKENDPSVEITKKVDPKELKEKQSFPDVLFVFYLVKLKLYRV